jgi:hypothetical protein
MKDSHAMGHSLQMQMDYVKAWYSTFLRNNI